MPVRPSRSRRPASGRTAFQPAATRLRRRVLARPSLVPPKQAKARAVSGQMEALAVPSDRKRARGGWLLQQAYSVRLIAAERNMLQGTAGALSNGRAANLFQRFGTNRESAGRPLRRLAPQVADLRHVLDFGKTCVDGQELPPDPLHQRADIGVMPVLAAASDEAGIVGRVV